MTQTSTSEINLSNIPSRHRSRWTNSELNNLHNEYEMKQLTVQEIAKLHKRSLHGILNKLEEENLIESSWENARGWSFQNALLKTKQNLVDNREREEEEEEEDDVSVEGDDLNDEDYVPEEEEEEEEEDLEDDEEEFDAYSLKQKVKNLEEQIATIYGLLEKVLPRNLKINR